MSEKYKYKKTIDTKIVKAVEEVLNTSVISAKKIKEGVINYVYKIKAGDGIFIAKVFSNQHWPEEGKLQWIEKQMRKHNIPHAKVVYYSRDSKYFPYGFMISEYVEGGSGRSAFKGGRHSFSESFFASGRILKKVHSIKIKKFGRVNKGSGRHRNFIENTLEKANEKLQKLLKKRKIEKSMVERINRTVRKILEPYERRFKPVLVHGDPSSENSILSDKGEFILIDWDNASSSIALWDYFTISSWWPLDSSWISLAKRTRARRAFFRGYGNIGFSQEEILEIEPAIHLLYYADLLAFFYERKDFKVYKRILKVIWNIIR